MDYTLTIRIIYGLTIRLLHTIYTWFPQPFQVDIWNLHLEELDIMDGIIRIVALLVPYIVDQIGNMDDTMLRTLIFFLNQLLVVIYHLWNQAEDAIGTVGGDNDDVFDFLDVHQERLRQAGIAVENLIVEIIRALGRGIHRRALDWHMN